MVKLLQILALLIQVFLVLPPIHVYLFTTPVIAFLTLVIHGLSVYYARKEKKNFIGSILGIISSVLLLFFLLIQMDSKAADAEVLTDQVTFYRLLFPVNLVSLILIVNEMKTTKKEKIS